MLGAIIGDIVGSRWEFNRTNDYNFEWLSRANDFTDDTICTIAVADALLKNRDFGESIHDWCNRYPYPKGGYGGRFAQWVHSNNPKPYNSFGNGAAMRVSPVAHWYEHLDEVLDAAAATALPTHNHDEGVKGAQTVALAVFRALQLNQHSDKKASMCVDELLAECVQFSDYDININKDAVINRFDETCQGTVPVALWIIGQSNGFEDAIRKAVCLGADADTLGAIVGSIAEAIWGIPEWMKEEALSYLPKEMCDVLAAFRANCPRKQHLSALMRWKLGLGNLNKALNGESPLPDKVKTATADDWKTTPMPDDPNEVSELPFDFDISAEAMNIIRKGHIPEAMEDHWFMYCDDEYIRYFRSWTGICAFEAHYKKKGDDYHVDKLRINHAQAQYGSDGDEASAALFCHLLIAESGGDSEASWQNYLQTWEKLNEKYSKKK